MTKNRITTDTKDRIIIMGCKNMKKINLLAAAVVAASLMAPAANAVDASFNGYFR